MPPHRHPLDAVAPPTPFPTATGGGKGRGWGARERRETGPVWAALALLLACRGHASPDACKEATDHYLDLAVAESPGAATMSAAQSAAVREVERGLKRAEPSFRAVEDHCEAVTRTEVSCASGAKTTKEWEACVERRDAR